MFLANYVPKCQMSSGQYGPIITITNWKMAVFFQSFDEYVQLLRNVLSNKAQCVASLTAQIQQLETMSSATTSHTSEP